MKTNTNNYRVYALIHGQTLPLGKIFDCEIKQMSYKTQKRRKFEPIKSKDFEQPYTEHKTFVSNIPYIDPKIVKSEHIITTEVQEDSPNGALGCAAKRFEKLCRFLSLGNLEDVKRTYSRNRGSFEPYIYQISKLYELDDKNKEKEVEYRLQGHRLYLPNRPERDTWKSDDLNKFLLETYNFHDDILHKSLKYLYDASVGSFENQSPEKISIDHMKSIEILISALSTKAKFKEKLKEAASKINLTQDEVTKIEYLWDQRSQYGDLAHPKVSDRSEYMPNQYPIPSNVEYTSGFLDALAPNVLLKYFYYIREFYTADVKERKVKDTTNNYLEQVYTQSYRGFVHANYYYFLTEESDKNRLKPLLKKAFAKELNVDESKIISIEQLNRTNDITRRKKSFRIRVYMKD